ncbi:multidrug transporter [Haloterrigena sp. H1]|uniref:multidrug transporter n=1 Tax=Haloterrigena sp. H1 TaxID=2552943 RepID=UPI00110E0670|nr:multidrug transporter [Haloterrigena sp. H1]TMT80329.1 multidrug transporter [Haloterrigena sp. H1]
MALSIGRTASPVITAIGIAVALIAIVGTQYFGWEWGSGQLVPTILGVAAAVIAVFVVFTRRG